MEMVGTAHMTSQQRHAWQALLQDAGLHTDEAVDYTVLLWEDGQLAATGSRAGNIFKYFTTAPQYRERGFSAAVMTELRQEAFSLGITICFCIRSRKTAKCSRTCASTPWHGRRTSF